jgi:hypothetical protein
VAGHSRAGRCQGRDAAGERLVELSGHQGEIVGQSAEQ